MGILFRPSLLDEAYASVTGRFRANLTFPHILSRTDFTFSKLCEVLKDELAREEHPAQLLLLESVSSSIALYLVGEFAIGKRFDTVGCGSLQPRLLKAVLDYIEDCPHLVIGAILGTGPGLESNHPSLVSMRLPAIRQCTRAPSGAAINSVLSYKRRGSQC
jgi:hypothetical protein